MTESTSQSASIGRKLLLMAVSLSFSLLLVEGLLRVIWTNPFVAEESELLVPIGMQPPNTDRAYPGPTGEAIRFRTDSRSYILPSRRSGSVAATVAFFGGSTTECSGVTEEARFPAYAGKLLADRKLPVDTLNAGRSGNTMHEALNVLLNHSLADKPDIAVIMHAANDSGILALNGDYSHAMARRDGLKWGLRAIARKLSATSSIVGMVRFSRLGGARHDGASNRVYSEQRQQAPESPFRQRLVAFVRLARSFGIEPVLMTQAMAYVRDKSTPTWAEPAKQAVFNDIIRDVGKREAATVIDLDRRFRAIKGWDKADRFFYDGLHLNDDGSRKAGEFVADGLAPLISSLKAK